jgi:hypothetical protein
MSFEENTWIYAVVSVAAFGVHLVIILGRAQGTPLPTAKLVACRRGLPSW